MRTKPNGSGCAEAPDPIEAELERLVAAEAEALAGDRPGWARAARAAPARQEAEPPCPGPGREATEPAPAPDGGGPAPPREEPEGEEPLAALLDRAAARLRHHPERAALLARFLAALEEPAPRAEG
ncbi:hypothetical protein [Crenalkalicoccus roseus]|uniref:hypothetical protein n=1 Tax=Crenalkalicoccus roseus TaxID=1485588 RepID=UPI001080D80A|nr:hypothetical protein [Crenalkalicoccus roseus]